MVDKSEKETVVEKSSKKGGASIGFISLGCPKALVDSERILTQLKTDGYEIVPNYDEADVLPKNRSTLNALF